MKHIILMIVRAICCGLTIGFVLIGTVTTCVALKSNIGLLAALPLSIIALMIFGPISDFVRRK